MMEFELLRSFVAVAECGGFRRAAELLNLTQSTVSQQIKRLELETKRPLFRRTTRTVALTDDGEMLLGDARRLLQFEEAARHRLAAPRLSGTVRLGVVEEVAGGSLPSALGRFAALHPGAPASVFFLGMSVARRKSMSSFRDVTMSVLHSRHRYAQGIGASDCFDIFCQVCNSSSSACCHHSAAVLSSRSRIGPERSRLKTGRNLI